MLSRYGQVFAFDNSEQVPELQMLTWPILFAKEATEQGFDVDGMVIEAGDRKIRIKYNQVICIWNWEVIE